MRRRTSAWLEIDHVRLKNKTRSVAVFTLAGGQAYAEGEEFQHLRALHEDILKGYRAQIRRCAANGCRCGPAGARRHSRALPLLSEAF